MAFRIEEEKQKGYDRLINYLAGPSIDQKQRENSKVTLSEIVEHYGPVVDAYPSWHPLVSARNFEYPITTPCAQCGYMDLDHTFYLRDAIITCPYGRGQAVFDSVKQIAQAPFISNIADISAEPIKAQLYSPDTQPILIKCNWLHGMRKTGPIPAGIAIALLLEQEIPCWRWSEHGETWDTMRSYFLGQPHGSLSSLFVNQDTGKKMKNIWKAIVETGMFGDIHLRP